MVSSGERHIHLCTAEDVHLRQGKESLWSHRPIELRQCIHHVGPTTGDMDVPRWSDDVCIPKLDSVIQLILDESHATKLKNSLFQKTTVKESIVSHVCKQRHPEFHTLVAQKPPPILNPLIGGACSLQVVPSGLMGTRNR